MLSLFELVALLLALTSALAWFNHRVLRLPMNIGLLTLGLAVSLLLTVVAALFPGLSIQQGLSQTIGQVDFYKTVMEGMLSFLLFAGALNVDIAQLRDRAPVIAALATIGVAISTLLMATGLWALAALCGVPLQFSWALVFGAIVAPTDPVAVLAALKSARIPRQLEMDMAGEALFNDGVAVVIFTVALHAATSGGAAPDFLESAGLLLMEAGGGAALGLATGYIAYRAMRSLDDYSIEVMISLALVMATYALASRLHMSGPIAVVVAGVLIGNHGADTAMSDRTKRYVFGFWTLVDDILNAILFLLIGLEVLVLHFEPRLGWIALGVVPLALVVRFLAVSVPVIALNRHRTFVRGTIPIMTWGGVRGGISVALALSLPYVDDRVAILAGTYAVVLFSVIVQGLTLSYVVSRRVSDADRVEESQDGRSRRRPGHEAEHEEGPR
jgi:monovalent cation:H+ antiporter, CPA1 family